MATADAFWSQRLDADSAARVIVRYMTTTGRDVHAELDPTLREAIARVLGRRRGG